MGAKGKRPVTTAKTRVKKKSAPQVEIFNTSGVILPRVGNLRNLASKVLGEEGVTGPINLVFCENLRIRQLNRDFRKLDKVTDVLSFEYNEDDLHGELYISAEQAKNQAPRWKNTFYAELKRLIVHGCLHLAGYDHLKKPDRRIMTAREDHYLSA